MNLYLIPIMFTAVLLLTGCAQANDTPINDTQPIDAGDTNDGSADTTPIEPDVNEQPDGPVSASYENGALEYSVSVSKPTPCHSLRVDETILESDPVRIAIDVSIVAPEPGRVCAQVIDIETHEGRITTSEPGTVTITTPNDTYEVTP